MFTKCIWLVLCLMGFTESKMEPLIVGGGYASIYRFPHSAFLGVNCVQKNEPDMYWICGGSIINQAIVMTAAHCVAGCLAASHISVTVGYEDRDKDVISSVSSFLIHENYKPSYAGQDIALLSLKTSLSFSSKVRRVALMKNPPYFEGATVAGWGIVDEKSEKSTTLLKYVDQMVHPRKECTARIKSMPADCLCASAKKKLDYASRGDSGSALMVRDYIQIGIVSFKMPAVAPNLIVYTDVGHHYEWIQKNSKRIFCNRNK